MLFTEFNGLKRITESRKKMVPGSIRKLKRRVFEFSFADDKVNAKNAGFDFLLQINLNNMNLKV